MHPIKAFSPVANNNVTKPKQRCCEVLIYAMYFCSENKKLRKEMKKSIVLSLTMLMSAFAGMTEAAALETTEGEAAKSAKEHRVLVVSMDDNIVSNYFTNDMLAEGTGISEDSICHIYNKVIENGLSASARKEKSQYDFVTIAGNQNDWNAIAKYARIDKKEENSVADLTTVNIEQLKSLMDKADASYLLVLDAHYMKYQDKPFKTLFHYVNYSLYDTKKNKLGQGSNYFTSINPQNKAQMMKSSRKSTEKMVEIIEKILD